MGRGTNPPSSAEVIWPVPLPLLRSPSSALSSSSLLAHATLLFLSSKARSHTVDKRTGEFRLMSGTRPIAHSTPRRLWNAVLGVFLQKGMIPQCFYWLPISAGYPSLVSFHILRTPLVSGRYLLSVLEGLHRTMRALQTLKDT